jgi:hypothetical protein
MEAGLRKLAAGQIMEKGKGMQREGFPLFEKQSNNEFKQEFEFQHPKMMHQHVCNSEFLYFINKIRKMIKCL